MTYIELKEMIKEKEKEGKFLPLSAENENGEYVVIEEGSCEGEHFYKLTIAQDNDWCRVEEYYEDGTITESYERGSADREFENCR